MTWLMVDKDGTEKCSNIEPFRWYNNDNTNGELDRWYYKYREYNHYKSFPDNITLERNLPCIILPKGSIKKLIGKKMSWKDEPYLLFNL